MVSSIESVYNTWKLLLNVVVNLLSTQDIYWYHVKLYNFFNIKIHAENGNKWAPNDNHILTNQEDLKESSEIKEDI